MIGKKNFPAGPEQASAEPDTEPGSESKTRRTQSEGEQLSSWQMPADTRGRIVTIVVLAVILMTIWFMLEIVIATFVLTFVFYHLQQYAIRGLKKQPIRFFKLIPAGIVQLIIYIVVIGLLVLFAVKNTPMLIRQITDIAGTISNFDIGNLVKDLDPSLQWLVGQIDFDAILRSIGSTIMTSLASIGPVVLNFLLSLLISFLLIAEKNRIFAIGKTMESSRIAFIYRYFMLFGGSFCDTFGKVMKVQVVIAAINCGVSMCYLTFAGFPYIAVLGLMIFILGLIPVVGVFISLVPLLIIAFNVGGFTKIVEVIIMIAVIHCIEAYFLNPRLMSRRTSLPVSVVFIILIISERYLGMWGMLIGVPIFIYILNVLSIDYRKAMEAESIREAAETAARQRQNGKKSHTTMKNPFRRRK